MKSKIASLLGKFGIGVTSIQNLNNLNSNQEELFTLRNFVEFQDQLRRSSISPEVINRAIQLFPISKAQLHQDLFVLIWTKFKSGGYFVEFGATDGFNLSNSFLLEDTFQWKGILAEPGKKWHASLHANRRAIIEMRCIWRTSGEVLEFNETENGELSTLEMFSSGDLHADSRVSGKRYLVETISLLDLLDRNNAPEYIDYLSVDTEGSEFEVLNGFNFDKYQFGFISCEHNYTESRERIHDLLVSKGYRRVLEDFSHFDDWYINCSLANVQGIE